MPAPTIKRINTKNMRVLSIAKAVIFMLEPR
jgi:hypothetical protein